jgi:hypothetical protein
MGEASPLLQSCGELPGKALSKQRRRRFIRRKISYGRSTGEAEEISTPPRMSRVRWSLTYKTAAQRIC